MSLSDILTAHADAFRSKTGVTSKLSITDTTKLMDYMVLDKLNLLEGTSSHYRETRNTTSNGYISTSAYHNNYWLSYAATIKNTSKEAVKLKYTLAGQNKVPLNHQDYANIPLYGYSTGIVAPGKEDDISVTFKMDSNTWFVLVAVVAENGSALTEDVLVKNERAYQSPDPGIWTPNPADKVGGGS